ncbi:MAG: glycosyltransferase [Bacteroidota bacterium]
MKIVQLVDSLEMGGTERMCVNIANGLNASGIENAVIVTRRPYTLSARLNSDTTLFTCNKKHRFDLPVFIRIYKFIRKEKPQCIHAHSTTLFWACILKILNPTVRLIWHDHFGNRQHAKDNIFHMLLSIFINGIIAVNDEITRWHIKHMSVKEKSIVCLPNFASLFPLNISQRASNVIVMNANMLPVKDHPTLLKALVLVKKQNVSFKLYLIGKDANPHYAAQVKEMIHQLDLSDNITLLGQVNDIEAILGEASIGVISSTSEGLPVSLLEYGLAGLAVVSTDVGQCAKVLGNGEFGWVLPSAKPELLAETLVFMLNNPPLAAGKAIKLKENVHQHYSEQTFMDSYKRLLHHLI